MRVVVRADSSSQIGIGHVVRCHTLARALRARGAHVIFVCEALPGNISDMVARDGFVVEASMQAISQCDWLIIDHYGLDEEFERAQRARATRILVIDDLANRRHDCDLLLDQNLYPDMQRRYSGRVPSGAKLLIGPRHALLREEFALAASEAKRRTALGRILVSFGGSDPTDESSKTLRALAMLRLAGVRIDLLVGAANPRTAALEELAREVPGCHLLAGTSQMARLMLDSDLMIGAGGSTTWERCCLALPALVIAVAENQFPIAAAVAERGYHRFLGRHEGISVDSLSRAIGDAARDFDDLAGGAADGPELVDGQGAQRVAEAMSLS